MDAKFRVGNLKLVGKYAGRNYNGHGFDGIFNNKGYIAAIINDSVVYIPKYALVVHNIDELSDVNTEDIIQSSVNLGQEIKEAMKKASDLYKSSGEEDFIVTCDFKGEDNYKIDGKRKGGK